MEGSGVGLIFKVLTEHSPVGTEKTKKTKLYIAVN
jgi:hypothetical protein